MRTRTKFPPWLERRGYSARLKQELLQFMKERRAEASQDRGGAEAEPRSTGKIIVLEHYRTLRVIAAVG